MKGPAGGPDMMVKEVSPTIVPFDVDDSDVDGSQKLDHMGCNVYDNKDMARMGRSQQMRVWSRRGRECVLFVLTRT